MARLDGCGWSVMMSLRLKFTERLNRNTNLRAPAGTCPVSARLRRSKAIVTLRPAPRVAVTDSASMFFVPSTSCSYGRCGPPGAGSGGAVLATAAEAGMDREVQATTAVRTFLTFTGTPRSRSETSDQHPSNRRRKAV
jgi:hypothetical protein